MNSRVTRKDLRSADYTGFLSEQIDPASRKHVEGRAVPLPKVRTIALNRGDLPCLISGNRKVR